MSEGPLVDLGGPENIFCAEHLEPLRAQWPMGYAILMMVLFQHAVRDREILRACGYTGPGTEADPARLGAAIREFGPLCCRLDPDEMKRWTDLALTDTAEAIKQLKVLEKTEPVL